MTSKRLGATAVVDHNNQVLGIITDGDLRRMLEQEEDLTGVDARAIMSPSPKVIPASGAKVSPGSDVAASSPKRILNASPQKVV